MVNEVVARVRPLEVTTANRQVHFIVDVPADLAENRRLFPVGMTF